MEGAWGNTIKSESNKEMIFLEINAGEKTTPQARRVNFRAGEPEVHLLRGNINKSEF